MAVDCGLPGVCGGGVRVDGLRKCAACGKKFYCSVPCQRKDWPKHKPGCLEARAAQKAGKDGAAEEVEQDDDLDEIRRQHSEFKRVVAKYGLDKGEKADAISGFLTGAESDGSFDTKVFSSEKFAEKFGMTHEDALAFLSFVDTGVQFKDKHLDNPENKEIAKGVFGGGGASAAEKKQ